MSKGNSITSFKGEYSFLLNFYEHPIDYRGKIWPTSEHAYQAMKTLDKDEQEKVRTQSTPGQSKRSGRQVTLRSDWEDVKVEFMHEILEVKFSDPELLEMLMSTGDTRLIEKNTWGDVFWGVCNGVGENWLGRILMDIRESNRGPSMLDMFSGE